MQVKTHRLIASKVDCLLINPPEHFARYPYLGLCYLAGALKSFGIKVAILDCTALKLKIEEVVKDIAFYQPAIIGISVMSMNLPTCYHLIQAIKSAYPSAIIVVGGAHINADPGIIGPMGVDYAFVGESEFAFAEFCATILGGGKPVCLSGLVTNYEGIISAQPASIVSDIDILPFPAYELLPLNEYYSPLSKVKVVSAITSRGCPYNCIYCGKLQKTPYRYLSIKKILELIDRLVNHCGIQWIEFVDEIFTLNKAHVIDLCKSISEQNYVFSWGIGTRADKIDEEIIYYLKKAGCQKIGFGVETGSERIRFLDQKMIANQQYIDAVQLCHKYKIKTVGTFILGHPTETKKEMLQTIKFASQLSLDLAYINKMIPIPNSKLFEQAKNSGRVAKNIWTSFMLGEKPHPIYYPDTVMPKDMDRIYRWAWIRFYFSPLIIWRNLFIIFKPKYFYKAIKAFLISSSKKRYKV
jgi:anaerobic magnesium-protoporphyrin IX monomethyl ester cyclase